jgi:hypothetical protein
VRSWDALGELHYKPVVRLASRDLLGDLWGPSGGSLRASWGDLGGLLGPLWALLGGLGGALGGLLGSLGIE